MKKTKIVCTIGPASDSYEVLLNMARAGMDVVRLNLSHGDYSSHKKIIGHVRKIGKELNRPIGIMLDLQGPKIRIGELAKPIVLKKGTAVILTHKVNEVGHTDHQVLPIQVDLRSSLKPEDLILIDDGKIHLKVLRVKGLRVWARVESGGVLSTHKGINLPNSVVKIPLVSKKDEEDLKFGLENDVDFVALSFVQHPRDLLHLQKLVKKHNRKNNTDPWIISKIEKASAVKEFEKILQFSGGAMVARGDLGVEIPAQEVPIVQKEIIELCLRNSKPSVVATQMLDSMVKSPTPTRAEVTDVANAVTDHADAVMLSQETAVGEYPVKAVELMSKIISETEASIYDDLPHDYLKDEKNSRALAVADSAHELSKNTGAKAIVGATVSGFTARMISHQRPQNAEIIMMTQDEKVYRQMSLLWGVRAFMISRCRTLEEIIQKSVTLAKRRKLVKKGDKIVIVTGQPVGQRENMNLVEVQTV
ncbi:MAG: pyruvate kinase [Candidatus Doudnabacteria bacterium CG10_big_fil_rev_8_21_14_0_10_41_10]|uniref:Pyruvate kinase n=1 Tax=Candidatus Doudnabacteria bacterium CG10_big_fil_rev_8_21_14_0_10_41_10 TaxID=1974551 RepID=A0A2H0VD80_9BACT|nr:MAG: pyruvate kinase [Candidatus Doudnabacteria bacterium CG10_big_fil_rev_8_21_14_0_10_41_10]